MDIDLPLIWAAIIAFGVFMYVFMDGFDLGVGILFPFAPDGDARDLMMNSVAPVWDANETWLVLGGTALLAVFPLAYSVLLTALYLPLTIMLIALIFRGVAFEFRFRATSGRAFWDGAFFLGSLVATLAQGMVLGAFVQGFETTGRDFSGGLFDWLTPFSLITGAGLVAGYTLLGSAWLILKTEDALQDWAYVTTRRALYVVLFAVVVVSAWTPLMNDAIARRWFEWPNIAYLSPVPVLTGVIAVGLERAILKRRERWPFLLALALFLLSYGGIAISLWPNVVPPDISIWAAASSPEAQRFLLAGTVFVIPAVLAYTAFSYYIFRGKVQRGIGYH